MALRILTAEEFDMNRAIPWALGLCCGVPLVLGLAVTGVLSTGSLGITVCVGVTGAVLGYVAWRYFKPVDDAAPEDDWLEEGEADELLEPSRRR